MFPCTSTKEEICFNNGLNSLMAIRGYFEGKRNGLFITVLHWRDTNTLIYPKRNLENILRFKTFPFREWPKKLNKEVGKINKWTRRGYFVFLLSDIWCEGGDHDITLPDRYFMAPQLLFCLPNIMGLLFCSICWHLRCSCNPWGKLLDFRCRGPHFYLKRRATDILR